MITHGREWIDQQWLAHVSLYGLWSAGGWPLVLLSDLVLYLAAFVVVAIAARLLGASERAVALAVMAGFALGASNTVLRAQIPAYVLFALVLLLCLLDERRPSGRVFLALPVLALWANVHGSVVLGAGLVALRGVTLAVGGLRARAPMRAWLPRTGALILLPWLCTLASPYGMALPRYYHRVLGNSTFANVVTEWAASTIRNDPYFFALLLPGVWLMAKSRSAVGPFAQLAFLGTAVAGLLAVRNIVWFALVAAATLPAALDDLWPPAKSPRRIRVNVALMTAGAIAAIGATTATLAHDRSWFESRTRTPPRPQSPPPRAPTPPPTSSRRSGTPIGCCSRTRASRDASPMTSGSSS